MLGKQVVYGGRRLAVRARLGGVPYGDPFRLDLSLADRLVMPPDRVFGSDLLEFIDVGPVEHSVYPEEAHVAEKLHAYAMPRDGRTNSRTKDLVDIGLLAQHTTFDADDLHRSIVATFEFRGTNPVPTALEAPPKEWRRRYEKMRDRDNLAWEQIDALLELCRRFLDPVLQHAAEGMRWFPKDQEWK